MVTILVMEGLSMITELPPDLRHFSSYYEVQEQLQGTEGESTCRASADPLFDVHPHDLLSLAQQSLSWFGQIKIESVDQRAGVWYLKYTSLAKSQIVHCTALQWWEFGRLHCAFTRYPAGASPGVRARLESWLTEQLPSNPETMVGPEPLTKWLLGSLEFRLPARWQLRRRGVEHSVFERLDQGICFSELHLWRIATGPREALDRASCDLRGAGYEIAGGPLVPCSKERGAQGPLSWLAQVQLQDNPLESSCLYVPADKGGTILWSLCLPRTTHELAWAIGRQGMFRAIDSLQQ